MGCLAISLDYLWDVIEERLLDLELVEICQGGIFFQSQVYALYVVVPRVRIAGPTMTFKYITKVHRLLPSLVDWQNLRDSLGRKRTYRGYPKLSKRGEFKFCHDFRTTYVIAEA